MTSSALPSSPVLRRATASDATLAPSLNGHATRTPSSLESPPLESAPMKLVDGYGSEFEIPDYTLAEMHKAIPKRCFERSGWIGIGYVARDMTAVGTTFYLAHRFIAAEYVSSVLLRCALWGLYTFLQGLFGTGVWILAHECGHQSFSNNKVINDTVGWILHSALLVPYFSWKISHGKHHRSTGNMEKDMAFVPHTRETYLSTTKMTLYQMIGLAEETPMVTVACLILHQLAGWPMYLISNATGHDFHGRQKDGRGIGKNGRAKQNGLRDGVNHFNPASPLYESKDWSLILLSDVGLLLMTFVLASLGKNFGWTNLLVWYFMPYLWWPSPSCNIPTLPFLTMIPPHGSTPGELQPRLTENLASSADICSTALLKPTFSIITLARIPFYHAYEATEAIKPIMGRHYRSDTKDGPVGFLKSLWTSFRMCQWVEPNEGATGEAAGVMFFRNRNGLGSIRLRG